MSQMGVFFPPKGGSTIVETLTGDTGGPVSPTAGNINIDGTGVMSTVGNPGTSTIDIQIGGGTAGQFLQSQGASPANWSTATLPSTAVTGDILYASSANTWSLLPPGSSGQVLVMGVSVPGWGASGSSGITLVQGTANEVTVTNGGGPTVTLSLPNAIIAPGSVEVTSGFTVDAGTITLTPLSTSGMVVNSALGVITTSATTNHAIQLGNSSGQLNSFSLGTSGQLLQSAGAGADPAWTTATFPSTAVTGDILYASSANTWSLLAPGTSGYVLQMGASVPSWQPVSATSIVSVTGTANQITANTVAGAVTLSTPNTFIAPGSVEVTSGFTVDAGTITLTPLSTSGVVVNNSSGVLSTDVTTNHAIQLGNSAGQLSSFSLGTSGQLLQSAGAGSDPAWTTATFPATTATGDLLYGSGANAWSLLTPGTNGYVLQMGASIPAWSPLSSSAVTSISGTANQITASASVGAVTLSTPSTFIAPGTIASTTTNAAGTNFLLPATSSSAGQLLINGTRFLSSFAAGDTFVGPLSGNTTGAGTNNTGLGYATLNAITTGLDNTGLGSSSLNQLTTGSTNIAIGKFAGTNYTGSESSNILLSHSGVLGESNVLRIGSASGTGTGQLAKAFIAGIASVSVSNLNYVTINTSTGQLGSVAASGNLVSSIAGTANQITASASTGAVTLSVPSTFIAPGSVEVTSGFTIDAGTITFSPLNSSAMLVTNSSGVVSNLTTTNHALQVGNSSGQITSLSLGTANQILQSNGAGFDPSWVNLSSLGVSSITGTANQVTASASTGAVTLSTPNTFIAPGSIEATSTVKADTNFLMVTTTSTAGQFKLNNTPWLHGFGTDNVFLGNNAGNFTLTATKCVCIGTSAGSAITSGSQVVYIGYQAGLNDAGSGTDNIGIGYQALTAYTGASNTGNIALGNGALGSLLTGARNVAIGSLAGSGYTGAENYNICIGRGTVGTAGESNVLRIGNATGTGTDNINKAVICGINGKTSSSGVAVLINGSDVLGTTTSSIRFKKNVQDIGHDSDILYDMRPVSFRYKEDDSLKQYGLIAEEVEDLDPDLVKYDREGKPETVRYHFLVPLLLNELQKLNKRVQELEKMGG